jgi:single-strand DNA-binding protein
MDSWDDKTTGEKRSKIRVQAERVQFLDNKRDGGSGMDRGSDDDMGASPMRDRESSPRRAAAAPSRGGSGGYGDSRGPASNGPSRSYGSQPGPSSGAPPVDDVPEEDDIPF